MKLKLKDEAGPTVDIGHGEYMRQFKRDDQPFTVSEEEGALLLGTALFEIPSPAAAEEKRKAPRETKVKE